MVLSGLDGTGTETGTQVIDGHSRTPPPGGGGGGWGAEGGGQN